MKRLKRLTSAPNYGERFWGCSIPDAVGLFGGFGA
jgi:hypothetical protein